MLVAAVVGAVLSLAGVAKLETGWPSGHSAAASSAPDGIAYTPVESGRPVASLNPETDYPAPES
ncbi:hypothetical protein C791_1091 [Amycolatopsis azurea DSM 43854]|uniref:Uncharacterized protein n=1 Tax=Amycolatopsis azurea DSM 43854 TaxID=1238180 RepID=M2QRK4_9PSEU|nr:hypothetical protein C791_1091 [Amycolatopsis azurea DSM 43854]